MNLNAQEKISKMKESKKNKLQGLYQNKSFCTAKETINKTKRPCMAWETIFANDISENRLVYKIFKEFTKCNAPKSNNPIKTRQKT